MASEAKRALIRIAANFGRLGAVFVMAIILVPLLLELVGNEGIGLIALMGSTVGIAAMLNDIVQASSIRELGAAYHGSDERAFIRVYNSALGLASVVGLGTLALFGVLIALMPVIFNISEEMLLPARLFVATQGLRSFWTVMLAPAFNMYQVMERMVAYNFWVTNDRLSHLLGALMLLLFPEMPGTEAVVWYGVTSTAIFMATQLLAVLILICAIDQRLVPRPSQIRWGELRELISMGGWNLTTRLAMDMHLRLDNYLMNLWLGVAVGNLIFGALSVTLTSSVRRIANGITWGVTAVSARLSVSRGNQAVLALLHHTMRLQAVVMFPTLAILLVLTYPILTLWVGKRLDDPTGELLWQTVILVRILAVGVCLRAVADGVVRILYGAGLVRQYAPLIFIGGVLNPIIAITLLVTLPEQWQFIGPACAFTLLMLVIHAIVLPMRGAHLLGARTWSVFAPLVPPATTATISSAFLVGAVAIVERWNVALLLAVVVGFSSIYACLTWWMVVTRQERQRIANAMLRRRKREKIAA